MIIGATGHRFLDGKGAKNGSNEQFVRSSTEDLLSLAKHDHPDVVVITGMAIGFDVLVAEVCVARNIDFIAAVPFQGQQKRWPLADQRHHEWLLQRARAVSYGAGELEQYRWVIKTFRCHRNQ